MAALVSDILSLRLLDVLVHAHVYEVLLVEVGLVDVTDQLLGR